MHPLKDFFLLSGGVLAILVIGIALLSLAADRLVQTIPFSVEHRLASKFPLDTGAITTGPTAKYLQDLAQVFSKTMALPKEMKIRVSLIDSDVVNAFATLDGNIVFFTGLLRRMPNENALAMVMAHEIAHVKLRHPLRSLGRGVVVGLAVATVAGVSANGMVEKLLGNTGALTVLSFTRDQESAADRLAVAALVKHYGHAASARQLFEILNASKGGKGSVVPEFFASHPLDENRIAALRAQIRQQGWQEEGNPQDIPLAVQKEITRLGNIKKKPKTTPGKRQNH